MTTLPGRHDTTGPLTCAAGGLIGYEGEHDPGLPARRPRGGPRRPARACSSTTATSRSSASPARRSRRSHRIPALRPDVAVLDARLPDGNGIDVCREVRSVDPSIQGLILTSYEDDEALFAAIMAGASGYVLKQIRGTDLVDAVRRVAAGQSMLDPAVTQRVLERIRSGVEEPAELKSLTEQERRILVHVAEGLTNREIAGEDVPGREDGEELRLQPAGQARPGAADPGRRTGDQAARRRTPEPAAAGSDRHPSRRASVPRGLGGRDLERAAEALGPLAHVGQPAPWLAVGRYPTAVVGDGHGHGPSPRPGPTTAHRRWRPRGAPHWTAPRAAPPAGRPELVGDGAVDRPDQLQRRAGSRAGRPPPSTSLADLGAQAARHRRAQLEDGRADVADGGVEVVHGRVDPVGHLRAWPPAGPRSAAAARWRTAAGSPRRAGPGRCARGPPGSRTARAPPGPGPARRRARPGRRTWSASPGPRRRRRRSPGAAADDQQAVQGARRWPAGPRWRAGRARRPATARPRRGSSTTRARPGRRRPRRTRVSVDRAASRRPGRRHGVAGGLGHLDGELAGVLVVQQHQHQLGLGDLAGPAGDQLQRLGAVAPGRAAAR